MSDVKYAYYNSSKGYKIVGGNSNQLLRADGGVEDKTDYSKKSANETLDGIKTFTCSPIVPTPTLNTHAVNKNYVDGKTNVLYKNTVVYGRVPGDYQFHVIPLCELTNDVIGADRFSDVKMLFKRNNTIQGLITELKITVAKIYNTNTPFVSFNHDGTNVSNLKFRIVTFTYNSKKYIGVDIRVIADYANNWIIEGYSNQWNIISAINYYTQNTNTIVNNEIHGSIVEYVPDVNINYNPYRKFSSGVETYGFKKVDSSDSYMLLGGGGHRAVSDFMTTTHPSNGITSSNVTNWNTAYGWGNHASVGYAMANHTHSWNEIENKPLTFVPTSHTHAISEVTGLSTELDEKSEKNADEEWTGYKILKHSTPFIIKQAGVKSWLLHKSNWNGSLFWAMSTSNDGVDWNWANQIEFKENGKIKCNGFEVVGKDDSYLVKAGGGTEKADNFRDGLLVINNNIKVLADSTNKTTNVIVNGTGSSRLTIGSAANNMGHTINIYKTQDSTNSFELICGGSTLGAWGSNVGLRMISDGVNWIGVTDINSIEIF